MKRTFEVNGKKYESKQFDFNTICDLEDMGISIEQMSAKPMSMTRAYFSLCSMLDKESAGKEMQEHLIKGGKFDELTSVMSKEMDESDFFRSLMQNKEENVTETKSKGKKATE